MSVIRTPSGVRTEKDVIDSAIRGNRPGEFLCYALIILFSLVGVGVLVFGAYKGEGLVALAGSITSMLFWPALSNARQIREQNLMIRLLEIPLSKETTAEKAAKTLQDVFLTLFRPAKREQKER